MRIALTLSLLAVTPVDDRAVFRVQRHDQTIELWVTDGTPERTHRVAGIPGSYVFGIVSAGAQAFYASGDYPDPVQLALAQRRHRRGHRPARRHQPRP